MPEVDVLMKGLLSQPGVEGFMVFNDAGERCRHHEWLGGVQPAPCSASAGQLTACFNPPNLFPSLWHTGIPLKWTQAGFVKPGATASTNPIPASVVHHASLLGDLTAKAKVTCARLLGESDGELQCLRLRTRVSEIIVAPGHDSTLVVTQKAHSAGMVPLVALAMAEAGGAAVAVAAADEKKK
jgi:hypothetical protein